MGYRKVLYWLRHDGVPTGIDPTVNKLEREHQDMKEAEDKLRRALGQRQKSLMAASAQDAAEEAKKAMEENASAFLKKLAAARQSFVDKDAEIEGITQGAIGEGGYLNHGKVAEGTED